MSFPFFAFPLNSRQSLLASGLTLCLLSGPSWLAAADNPEGKKESEESKKPPPTHTLKRGALEREAKLDAYFQAKSMEELMVDPKAWSDLTVKEVVPHGAEVKKGDVVLQFELEKITDQIAELEKSRPGSLLALEVAEAELNNLQQTTPMKLQAAERSQKRANEDYSYFESTDRADKEKATEMSIKSAEQRLANAQEELDQLQKMYEADDLTEETEEIIIKRQQYSVEMAEYYLENAQRNAKRSLEVLIPREGENLRAEKQEKDLAWDLAQITLPRTLEQKRLQVDKMRRDLQEADEKLADYQHDRALLTVKAPQDGIVYYGAQEHGKWSTGAALSKKLSPGGKVGPREIFMTVVDPEELTLHAVVPEKQLSLLRPRLQGEASPVSFPDLKMPATIQELSYIALPEGGFPAEISVRKPRRAPIMPGMACQLTFVDDSKSDVLLAPKNAVFGEGKSHHVFLPSDNGEARKVEVEVGDSDDDHIEIKSGVKAGDKILLKKPE